MFGTQQSRNNWHLPGLAPSRHLIVPLPQACEGGSALVPVFSWEAYG